jgi:hypothetical protein
MIGPYAAVRRCRGLLAQGGTLIDSVNNMRHCRVTLPLLFFRRFNLVESDLRL